jgi:DUF4097 and DUF4098 domain-containing protein YvlB
VIASEIKGAAKLATSFGAIEAHGLHGGAQATTGNGHVRLNDVTGDTYVKTSFGSVDVKRVNGNVTVENSNGQVTVNSVKGDVSAKTSFAGTSVEDATGQITVDNQNGGVTIAPSYAAGGCKNISAKTSFSTIQVRLSESAGYDVTARTSFGHIKTDLSVTSSGDLGGDALNGKIGNGGCRLSLTNSNGGIEILKASR